MASVPPSAGQRANQSGNKLEALVSTVLTQSGYVEVPRAAFLTALELKRFARQWPIGPGIYGTPMKVDFAVMGIPSLPNGSIIEVKWQSVSGSVDEKLPYLALNIDQRFPFPTIVVIDGGGWKRGAIAWLKGRVPYVGNLFAVYSMSEFIDWSNQSL
ncbi:PD-(D/E)XK nuclease superfamily protein [Sulfobacillus harzensis]|uniref:PD-(D/E)XK nuclease domain-containing protein n=1 Tax=Sulfobacillus harzensis TaxID=2729629 RepID=A0A7Y0Q3H5_9FIRM|nr:PD-(D/E)XK nuclease superfamily protein [Sulfobacillus harzensis]NMP24258.1 hypothetical protein [Sulfobacillus harzensis]